MNDYSCSICGCRVFQRRQERPFLACGDCGAMERQRALWKMIVDSGLQPTKVIEISPLNEKVFGHFLTGRFPECRYIGIDKWERGHPVDPRDVNFAHMFCDVCDLDKHIPWKADMLIMQHVLEEVPDYKNGLYAIRESLNPKATAYLEIPMDAHSQDHVRHRPNQYGNVWHFSCGRLNEELNELFDSVLLVPYDEGGQQGKVFVCGT